MISLLKIMVYVQFYRERVCSALTFTIYNTRHLHDIGIGGNHNKIQNKQLKEHY